MLQPRRPIRVPEAPWLPSDTQRAFLRALCASDPDALPAWARALPEAGPPGDVVPLLPVALRRLAGIAPDTAVARAAQAAYLEHVQANLVRMARLLTILECFERAGIAALVLKGAALNLAYYRTQGERGMADVDLLVQPGDVAAATGHLAGLGWTAGGDTTQPVQDARLRVHHALTFSADPFLSLDLHWRAGPGLSSDLFRSWWDRRETRSVEGTPVHVPGREDLLHHVLVHAVQPNWLPSARWLLDAWKVIADDTRPPLAWGDLVARAAALSTAVRVREGLRAVRSIAPALVPGDVMTGPSVVDGDRWQAREAALFTRMPPYGYRDILGWHWYVFRRLRAADPLWRGVGMTGGFAAYLRLRWRLRRRA